MSSWKPVGKRKLGEGEGSIPKKQKLYDNKILEKITSIFNENVEDEKYFLIVEDLLHLIQRSMSEQSDLLVNRDVLSGLAAILFSVSDNLAQKIVTNTQIIYILKELCTLFINTQNDGLIIHTLSILRCLSTGGSPIITYQLGTEKQFVPLRDDNIWLIPHFFQATTPITHHILSAQNMDTFQSLMDIFLGILKTYPTTDSMKAVMECFLSLNRTTTTLTVQADKLNFSQCEPSERKSGADSLNEPDLSKAMLLVQIARESAFGILRCGNQFGCNSLALQFLENTIFDEISNGLHSAVLQQILEVIEIDISRRGNYNYCEFISSAVTFSSFLSQLVGRFRKRDVLRYFNQIQNLPAIIENVVKRVSNSMDAVSLTEQRYCEILDIILNFDSCDWFKVDLSTGILNDVVAIAGAPWAYDFKEISTHHKVKVSEALKNSPTVIAKAIKCLRLEIFQHSESFVSQVYLNIMNLQKSYPIIIELLHAIQEVNWLFKRSITLEKLLRFVAEIDDRNFDEVPAALSSIPCIFYHQLRERENGTPLRNGCDILDSEVKLTEDFCMIDSCLSNPKLLGQTATILNLYRHFIISGDTTKKIITLAVQSDIPTRDSIFRKLAEVSSTELFEHIAKLPIASHKVLSGIRTFIDAAPLEKLIDMKEEVCAKIFKSVIQFATQSSGDIQNDETVSASCILNRFAQASNSSPSKVFDRFQEEIVGFVTSIKAIRRLEYITCAKFPSSWIMEFLMKKHLEEWQFHEIFKHLADQEGQTEAELLEKYLPYYFSTLLLTETPTTVKKRLTFLSSKYNFDAVRLGKQKVQTRAILNHTLCKMNTAEDFRIERLLSLLCDWNEDSCYSLYNEGVPSLKSFDELRSFIGKNFYGFLVHVSWRICSPDVEVELKESLIRSFGKVLVFLGSREIAVYCQDIIKFLCMCQCRKDVVIETWECLLNNLEDSVLKDELVEIMSSLTLLRDNASHEQRVRLDELVFHLLYLRHDPEIASESTLQKLYFLEENSDNEHVKELIQASVNRMKLDNWRSYFRMLIEEANKKKAAATRFIALKQLARENCFQMLEVREGDEEVSLLLTALLAALGEDDQMMKKVAIECLANLGALDPLRFRDNAEDRDFVPRMKISLSIKDCLTDFIITYLRYLSRQPPTQTLSIANFELVRIAVKEMNIKMDDNDGFWQRLTLHERITLARLYSQLDDDFRNNTAGGGQQEEDYGFHNFFLTLLECFNRFEFRNLHQMLSKSLPYKHKKWYSFVLPFATLIGVLGASTEKRGQIARKMKELFLAPMVDAGILLSAVEHTVRFAHLGKRMITPSPEIMAVDSFLKEMNPTFLCNMACDQRSYYAALYFAEKTSEIVLMQNVRGLLGDMDSACGIEITSESEIRKREDKTLVRAYLDAETPEAAKTFIQSALSAKPDFNGVDTMTELHKWEDIGNLHPNKALPTILFNIYKNNGGLINMSKNEIANTLAAYTTDIYPYNRSYPEMIKLHILSEAEDVICLKNKTIEWSELKLKWEDRLARVAFSKRVEILKARKNLLYLDNLFNEHKEEIEDILLTLAKTNISTSDQFLLEARNLQLNLEKVSLLEAEVMISKGECHRALTIIDKGLASGMNTENHAKALSIRATLLEDFDEIVSAYMEAGDLNPDSEENWFALASYYDRCKEDVGYSNDVNAVEFYARSLQHGCNHAYSSLPRLLSIFFEIAVSEQITEDQETAVSSMKQSIASTLLNGVPARTLLIAFTQLISWVSHPYMPTWDTIQELIIRTMTMYPHHTIWHTMSINQSTHSLRNQRCKEIYNRLGNFDGIISNYSEISKVLTSIGKHQVFLTDTTVECNVSDVDDRIPVKVSAISPGKILLPLRKYINPGLRNTEMIYVERIKENIIVLGSKVKPKVITVVASNGKSYKLLCKPEDDLRKDARIMEMFDMINWCFSKHEQAKLRNLHVTTYAVVHLNEDCGILEWLPDLVDLKSLLADMYIAKGIKPIGLDKKDFLRTFDPSEELIEEREKEYLENRHGSMIPVLGDWFFCEFDDFQSWHNARLCYIKSVAVTSIIGYAIGLGDRHVSNILVNKKTGGVVHVDYDRIFSDEYVYFRLTSNIIDGMGPLKFDGLFMKCCEIVLQVLQDNISIINTLFHEPLGTSEKQFLERRLDGSLPVADRVRLLIEEAISTRNLCKMYGGFTAHI